MMRTMSRYSLRVAALTASGLAGCGRTVTFVHIEDSKSVIEIDPNDLQATLGADISWNDGKHYSARTTLANTLSTADFQ
jgi:hypothetical protein